MPNATNLMSDASASFNDTFSAISLTALFPVILITALLLLLTSQRFFKYLSPIFGNFATWIKRVTEGYIVYNLGYLIYWLGQTATETLTAEDLLNLVKWGAAFTIIGYTSVWTRNRILENAGVKLPTLSQIFTDSEDKV